VSIEPLLLCFEPDHRRHQWWWGNMDDKDVLVDMVALDLGPRIFAGCIATWYSSDYRDQHCSEVFKYDNHGIPTWYVFVVELQHGEDMNIDLVVHADTMMMDVMSFVFKLFHMPLIPSSMLILWGLDAQGEVNDKSWHTSVVLNTDSTSAILHMRFADVFARMQQAATIMNPTSLEEASDYDEPHFKWRTIVKLQATLSN
jgi:hypothetical protein